MCFNLRDAIESDSFTSNMPSTAKVGFTGKAHHLEAYPEAIKKVAQAVVSRGEAQGLPLALCAHPQVTDCTPSPFSATMD